MDEKTLRTLLDRATAELPSHRPIGQVIAESRRAGRKLRSRRLIGSTTASVAGVAVIAIAASFVSGALGNGHKPSPANNSHPSGQMAYVLTYSGDVVPVNLTTMKAGPPLQTGLNPAWKVKQGINGPDIVAARGGRTLYVSTLGKPKVLSCSAPGTCREDGRGAILSISTATGRIVRRITVAGSLGFSDNLVGTPNGKVAYAMDVGFGYLKPSAMLTPIDLTTGTKLGTKFMPFSAMTEAAMSLNSKTLLLSGSGSGGTVNTVVSMVNVASEHAQRPVSFKFGPDNLTCVAISPNGDTGYIAVTTTKPAVVVPIDVATDRPLKAIKLPSVRYSHRMAPSCSMAVAPDGRTAYVLAQRYVMPIDLVTGKVLRPIKLPGWSPSISSELAIDPNGTVAYALTGQDVTPIDLATNTALPAIGLGHRQRGCWYVPSRTTRRFSRHCGIEMVGGGNFLSFSPNGQTVLVGLEEPNWSGKLLPIQAATGKAGRPIPLPGAPDAIAVTP